MPRKRLGLGLILVAFAAAPPTHGDEPEPTPEREAALQSIADGVRETLRSGGLTEEAAWAFDLDGFAARDVQCLPDFAGEDAKLRRALEHLASMTSYRRSPVGRLERARGICFLLGSPRGSDWLEAFRLLRREPLGDNLDRAVIALGRDARPELRVIAAKMATSLIFFGRKAEGLVSTVVARFTDPDPNVAAACAFGSVNTRNKRVMDGMVAILSDDREVRVQASPLLDLGPHKSTVGKHVSGWLSWVFWKEERARWKFRYDRVGEPQYAERTADEIRAWWKENRESYGFGTPESHWRRLYDEILVLELGKKIQVPVGMAVLRLRLKEYRELWAANGKPRTSVEVAMNQLVDGEESPLAGGSLGNPTQYDWSVSKVSASGWQDADIPGEVACKAAFLPTHNPRRVRMKLTIYVGHEE